MTDQDVVGGEEAWSENSFVFEEEPNVVHYVQASGLYNDNLPVNCLVHMHAAKCAIQFWRKCLPASVAQIV